MSSILRLDKVSKAFGAVTVADNMSFELRPGEALGVIGPNGAGKTSLFNLITGTMPADSGSMFLNGEDITGMAAPRRCRAGIARSFQVPQPFGGMTVFENALVAATQGADMSLRDAERHCLDILEQTQLMAKANVLAGKLTLLERKRLELTRALCAKPKLLLLDEIAGGLTEGECAALVDTIKSVHAGGMTIVWIEHVVHALLSVVDRLVVINFGRKVADDKPNEIMASRQVQEIYLGIDANG